MQKEKRIQLWFAPSDDGYYLIPDEVSLSEGETELITYLGKSRHVDLREAARYEVSKETATRFIQDRVENFFSTLSEKITDYMRDINWEGARDAIKDILTPSAASKSDPTPDDDEDDEGSVENVWDIDQKGKVRTLH